MTTVILFMLLAVCAASLTMIAIRLSSVCNQMEKNRQTYIEGVNERNKRTDILIATIKK